MSLQNDFAFCIRVNNDHIPANYLHSQHLRHQGVIQIDNDSDQLVVVSNYKFPVNTSFIMYHPDVHHLLQSPVFAISACYILADEQQDNQNKPKKWLESHHRDSSGLSSLGSDIINNIEAFIIFYEIWFRPPGLEQQINQTGTFSGELALNNIIKKSLGRCIGMPLPDVPDSIDIIDPNFEFQKQGCINWNNDLPLFDHQITTLSWMINIETNIDAQQNHIVMHSSTLPLSQSVNHPCSLYYHRQLDLIIQNRFDKQTKIPVKGGIVCDVTGSGKTAVVLALVTHCKNVQSNENNPSNNPNNPSNNPSNNPNIYIPQTDNTLTTPLTLNQMLPTLTSSATLIITPLNLPWQWLHEIEKFIQKTTPLKVVKIFDSRQMKKCTLDQLLRADIVLTTQTFLQCKKYDAQKIAFIQQYLPSYARELESCTSLQSLWNNMVTIGARTLAYQFQKQIKKIGFLPLELIKWKRIVLDEIHTLFSRKSTWNIYGTLRADYYFGLTGTPMTENSNLMMQYIKWISYIPPCWSPQFLQTAIQNYFHQIPPLTFTPLNTQIIWIHLTPREMQLLKCFQDDYAYDPEKSVQCCSYFNYSQTCDINQNIQLYTIEDIIKRVKKLKRNKIRELEIKIKNHESALKFIVNKIEEAKHNGSIAVNNAVSSNIILTRHQHQQFQQSGLLYSPPSHPALHPAQPNNQPAIPFNTCIRDIIKSRDRRVDRLTLKREQLIREKQAIEKTMNYFDQEIHKVNDTIHQLTCPICMTDPANVITHCGHIYCRSCLVKSLKTKLQCPLCKTTVTVKEVAEIKETNATNETKDESKEGSSKYGTSKYGSKMTKLMELVLEIIKKQEKVVIYSQWTSLTIAVKEMFRERNIEICALVGNAACQNAAIRRFKQDPQCQVLIGSIEHTGLDLVQANHLIFMHAVVGEAYMVAAVENQARARVHRTGQTKPVFVYHLTVKNSFEEQVFCNTHPR